MSCVTLCQAGSWGAIRKLTHSRRRIRPEIDRYLVRPSVRGEILNQSCPCLSFSVQHNSLWLSFACRAYNEGHLRPNKDPNPILSLCFTGALVFDVYGIWRKSVVNHTKLGGNGPTLPLGNSSRWPQVHRKTRNSILNISGLTCP